MDGWTAPSWNASGFNFCKGQKETVPRPSMFPKPLRVQGSQLDFLLTLDGAKMNGVPGTGRNRGFPKMIVFTFPTEAERHFVL